MPDDDESTRRGPDRAIRVVVADDQALVRGGIRMLLSVHADLDVVAEASDGSEALRHVEVLHPDVVVMDLRMPGLDGVEATRRLTADVRPDRDPVRVLVLTTFDDDDSVYGALRSGADGFLLKEAAPAHLVEAIRVVASGHSWLDPAVAGRVIRVLRTLPETAPRSELLTRLTPRETEVLSLMAAGLSNGEITQRLVLSEATTRTHVSRILMKTGSRDRAQAVVLAYQSGLVRPLGS